MVLQRQPKPKFLNYNLVSCLLEDPIAPDQYLWIATKGGGLNRLDKISGNYFHLTQKEGLPDNVVYGILQDDQGNIWGSTNKGIFCMTVVKTTSKYPINSGILPKPQACRMMNLTVELLRNFPMGSLLLEVLMV